MKRLIPLALVLLFMAACAAQAESVKLVHKFKSGESDNYKISIVLFVSAPALSRSVDGTIDMTMCQRTLEVMPDGSARVRRSYSVDKVSGTGLNSNDLGIPKQFILAMTVDPHGGISQVQGLEMLANKDGQTTADSSLYTTIMGFDAILPAEAVEVNSIWKRSATVPMLGVEMAITGKVLSVGGRLWSQDTVKIGQDFSINSKLGSLLQTRFGAPAGSTGTSATQGNTELEYAPAIGKLLRGQANLVENISVSVPSSTDEIEVEMRSSITITRFK